MKEAVSKDGTTIAFDQSGQGPVIVLVMGAFNERSAGGALAQFLERRMTVVNYDRRGRGDSGDTEPYAIEREIEDLEALIAQAGGSACVFGFSSGAVLALRAAAQCPAVSRLALFDPPPTGGRPGEIAPQLSKLIADGRRGDAVEFFQTEAVGIPPEVVAQLRNAPFRPALEKMAHTLIYESTLLGPLPAGLTASVTVPTLVMAGDQSPDVLRNTAQAFADELPDGRYYVLEGIGHDLVPEIIGPVLEEFVLGESGSDASK